MKPGTKPQGKVKIKWSPNFAYAIGLIATDGCIYSDRHVGLTSKDLEQIQNYLKALDIKVKIGKKTRSKEKEKKYYHVQFGDVLFCNFLNSIGITKRKSKTISEIKVPDKYFFDYLRGAFDGDGSSYSYWDPRWKSSYMFYISFTSASRAHIDWLRKKLLTKIGASGHICIATKKVCYQLKYAKAGSLLILRKMYYDKKVMCLSRKRLKVERCLAIVGAKL